ncbi:MAG TPA: glycoside hydrolase family 44 protein [Draconibacterium sp.]|nr:glycoside hydrolase family 44 protein [Draconibacterium sp.]
MSKHFKITLLLLIAFKISYSQPVQITVNANSGKKQFSPYIFGKNNVLPSTFLNNGTNDEIKKSLEAGVRFVRQSGGNNSTKYNWRLKLSSHPDWYNNVYANNWDAAAKNLTDKLPGVQGMWSFQLLGKVASNTNNNFPDWNYNQSKWWEGVNQNLAGGGIVNPAGTNKALVEGNPDLYLMNWPADSTVGILDHWFGTDGLGYDSTYYRYWSMDNEIEIWSGTHDDVMKTQIPAEEFMQLYFKVAKAARSKYPGIKLSGPVPANEWQWYRYGSDAISYNGKKYCWLEYFILRIAEEEKATGIKLLDVLDIHYYPGSSDATKLVQFYRVFFDRNYVYPEANGVKTVNGGWDNNQNKEYILGRCSDWLVKYKGVDHGVKFGVTETGLNTKDANVQASWYASTLGEFMKNGVEIFTPWIWEAGMWETVHLFSRYSQEYFVGATSSDETYVSAYPTVNEASDSMTIFLVNRHTTAIKDAQIDVRDFAINNEPIQLYTLSKLPATETFISHKQNALKVTQIDKPVFHISVQLEPLSVNAIVLKAAPTAVDEIKRPDFDLNIYPNPAKETLNIDFIQAGNKEVTFEIFNASGQSINKFKYQNSFIGKNHIETDISKLENGIYWISVRNASNTETKKFIVNK